MRPLVSASCQRSHNKPFRAGIASNEVIEYVRQPQAGAIQPVEDKRSTAWGG